MKTVLHFIFALFLFSTFSGGLIIAQPSISAPPIFDFGEVKFEQQRTINNFIWNEGNEVLLIEDFFVNSSHFSVEIFSDEIHPHMTTRLVVTFVANEFGNFSDTLTIISNDPNAPVLSIPLTAEVIFSPPAFFSGQLDGNDIQLFWGINTFEGQWLQYDKTDDLVGVMMGGAGTLRVGAKWPASQLTDFVGSHITKLAYIPINPEVEYRLQIWEGENGDNLLLNQLDQPDFYEVYSDAVILDSPIEIEENKTYWFAIEVTSFADEQVVLSYNLQNTNLGLGDMIFRGSEGWQRFEPQGFDGNWNIRALVESPQGQMATLETNSFESNLENANYFSTDLTVSDIPLNINESRSSSRSSGPVFLGYNLYRNGSLLNTTPLTTTEFLDEDLPNGVYTYGLTKVFDLGESAPRSLTFQVGAPFLELSTDLISDHVEFDSLYNYQFTLFNTGGDVLEWSMVNSLPPYLQISETSGEIGAGDSTNLTVELNSKFLPVGDNNFFLTFSSNNQFQENKSIRLKFNVEPIVSISLDGNSINFGMVPVNEEKLMSLEIKNEGNVRTFIYPIQLENTDNFRANFIKWVLDPGESTSLLVFFKPDADIEYSNSLSFNTFNPYSYDTFQVSLNGQGVIPPPVQLSGEYTGENIELKWYPPGFALNELVQGNGVAAAAVMTPEPIPFEVGARFDAMDLMPYSNRFLSSVNVFLFSTEADFLIKVYTDESGEQPLYEIPMDNPQLNQWNEVSLPERIELNGLENLWLSYEIFPQQEYLPIATDLGPAIVGKGDMVRIAGSPWQNLSSFAIDLNWAIFGGLSNGEGLLPDHSEGMVNSANRSSLNLQGYKVFRDGIALTSDPIQETHFIDGDVTEGSIYSYEVVAVYDIGESAAVAVDVEVPFNFTLPPGWEFTPTNAMHNIHLPAELDHSDIGLQKGDLIGLFYERDGIEYSAGVMYWDGHHRVITAYGNDPHQSEAGGFKSGESFIWKVFRQESGTVSDLIAQYDTNMPQYDGKYRNMGLSMLTALYRSTVNTVEETKSPISIFPNPAVDHFTVKGQEENATLKIHDLRGIVVKKVQFDGSPIDIAELPSGMYLIEIVDSERVNRQALIIR